MLVNIPLLKLIDGLPSVEEVEAEEHGAPEPAPTRATPARGGATLARQRATHNRNTSNTTETSSPDMRVTKCLAVLEEVEMNDMDRKRVESTLLHLLSRFPVLTNPVDTCRRYLDVVAAKQEPIKWHHKYLAGHFQREAAKAEEEPPNPHGPDFEKFKDKPRRADWYVTFHGGTVEDYQEMIEGGLPHSEIEAAIARRRAA